MPRIDKAMLKGLSETKGLHAERVIGEEDLEVEVLHDTDLFERYVTNVYDAVTVRWLADHCSEEPPVTSEDAVRYAYTATRTRVARVNNERFHTRCDDRWCIPAQIAVPINAVGRVIMERRIVSLVPRWNEENDDKVMSREEWVHTSRRMRALADYPGSKLIFADALAGDRSGDEILMSLIPVRDSNGRITKLQSDYDIDPIAAAMFLISGLDQRSLDGVALPDHPMLMSASYIRVAGVLRYLDLLAEVGT